MLESVGVNAFNYKKETIAEGLSRLAPGGIDCAFDNVGGVSWHSLNTIIKPLKRNMYSGETLETILEMLNDGGSVAVCGARRQSICLPTEHVAFGDRCNLTIQQ